MTQLAVAQRLRTVVALAGGPDPMLVEAAVSGSAGLEVIGFMHDVDAEAGRLEELAPEVLVVACSEELSDGVAAAIREFTRRHPDRPVLVLCGSTPNGLVRRAIEAGADDVVPLPAGGEGDALEQASEQIAFALQKALARKDGVALAGTTSGGRLICVLGPKGGIGKTLTASNLAVSFADAGYTAAIVDLDLQFGDIGLTLGLAPEKTIYDLARTSGSLDEEKVAAFMAVHSSGVRVLLAPTRPDQASVVTPEFLTPLYAVLRSAYDYVIVDTPPGFNAEVIASIDSSSDVCMVGTLDSLSLKNTKLGLETLDLMGYPRDRVCLVLNRADSRVGITRGDVVTIMGREPEVLVPSTRDIARSVNEGAPIALAQPRSEAGRAFRELAAVYHQSGDANGTGNAPSDGRRRGFRRKGA
jgi:pilus assembly protein CpaE